MRLLPPDRRDALFAIYALARQIDDIADGSLPTDEKLAELAAARAHALSPAESTEAVFVAVADAAARFPIPLDAFGDLVDGAEADVRGDRYETFDELERYCRCVAGSIGRLSLGVFDCTDRIAGSALADDLGVAPADREHPPRHRRGRRRRARLPARRGSRALRRRGERRDLRRPGRAA